MRLVVDANDDSQRLWTSRHKAKLANAQKPAVRQLTCAHHKLQQVSELSSWLSCCDWWRTVGVRWWKSKVKRYAVFGEGVMMDGEDENESKGRNGIKRTFAFA